MNELIKSIFSDFKVGGVSIPVKYMYYMGHGEPYVTWMHMDSDNSLTADDALIGYVDYYDFDVYSKGNFMEIVEQIKKLLIENGTECWERGFETNEAWSSKVLCIYAEIN